MCGSEEHASRWTAEEVENSVMPPPPPPPLPRKVIRGPSSPLRFAGGILLYAALAQLVSRGLDRSCIHSLLFPRGGYAGRGWFEEFCAELPFIAAGGKRKESFFRDPFSLSLFLGVKNHLTRRVFSAADPFFPLPPGENAGRKRL